MLLLLSVAAALSLNAASQTGVPPTAQLDAQSIQALMREVGANQEKASAKLERYSYMLKRTEHQLNDQGEGTKYRVHEYRVFPLRQGGVAAMLSENGQQLSAQELAKEQATANKEWQKQRSKIRNQKPDIAKLAKDKMVPWFETLDFTVLPPERLEGREMIVLGFTPRADYSPGKRDDKFMAALQGQIWIDPTEKMIVKFHAELTRDFSPGNRLSGWLDALKPGTQLTIKNARLANGLWAVKQHEFSSIERTRGPLWLPHTHRFRWVDEMSDYRPFDPEAKDLFLK